MRCKKMVAKTGLKRAISVAIKPISMVMGIINKTKILAGSETREKFPME